jgi:hypothetical protein
MYLNVVNEVAVRMLKVTEFADDRRGCYRIWEQETSSSSRQLWEDRAKELIELLDEAGIKVEES